MAGSVKIISIGGGWVTNNRHIPSILKNPRFELIGVIAGELQTAKHTAKRFKIKNYANVIKLDSGWQAQADAVVIGTAPHLHYDIAQAALENGKHVLLEKPMIVDPARGRQLHQFAKAQKRVLAVIHNFQFARSAHRFQEDLAGGRIGKIRAIYGVRLCNGARRAPAWCEQLPFGLFFDVAPHFYYMFRWLAESNLELLHACVRQSSGNQSTPGMVTGEYQSATGFPLYLHINFASSLTEMHFVVAGDKGVADIDVGRDVYIYLPGGSGNSAKGLFRTSFASVSQHLWGVCAGGMRYVAGRHLYGNQEVQDRFYRAIRGDDALKGMDAEEGIRVVEMIYELIQRAVMR